MTAKKNNSGDQAGSGGQPAAQPPTIGKPRMDHRILTKETKPDSSKTVRTGS